MVVLLTTNAITLTGSLPSKSGSLKDAKSVKTEEHEVNKNDIKAKVQKNFLILAHNNF